MAPETQNIENNPMQSRMDPRPRDAQAARVRATRVRRHGPHGTAIGTMHKLLCDQRRTMQPGIGTQLVQNKPCDVFSRYSSTMEVGKIRQRPDGIAARLVVQHGRTNENPVEAAFSDDRFLPVLVGVHVAQEERENQVVGVLHPGMTENNCKHRPSSRLKGRASVPFYVRFSSRRLAGRRQERMQRRAPRAGRSLHPAS